MAKLYDKIVLATTKKDIEAIWSIIEQYRPYIINTCLDTETKIFDEDLMSEIITKLPDKILKYKIYD